MLKLIAALLISTALNNQIFTPLNSVTTRAKVLHVQDTDTIRVEICKTFSIRLIDVWAPELKSDDPKERELAEAGKKFLQETLAKATDVSITAPLNDEIAKSFTFGRLLGIVHAKIDDKWININELLVEKGYATKKKEAK